MRALPRSIQVLVSGELVAAVGAGLTAPFLLVYLHAVLGIGIGTVGLILGAIAGAGLLGNPIGGWLADRWGARPALICGLLIAAAGVFALSRAGAAADAMPAALGLGFGAAVAVPAMDTLLATLAREEDRAKVFAIRYATMNLGLSAGCAAGALAVSAASAATVERLLALHALGFVLFAVLTALFVDTPPARSREDGPGSDRGYRAVLADRRMRRLLPVVGLLFAAGIGQYQAAFPALATQWGGISASILGLAFAANALTIVAAQLPVLRLVSNWPRTRGVAAVGAAWATAWIAALTAHAIGAVGFALSMVLFGIGEAFLAATLAPLINDLAPDALRGRYNGACAAAMTCGLLAGPAVSGAVLAAGLDAALVVALAAGCVVATAGALVVDRRPRRADADVRSLVTAGADLWQAGRYPAADAVLARALALAESTFGAEDRTVADVLNVRAINARYWGCFAESERYYARALHVAERVFGPDHPDLASLHHNLGGLAHARGDLPRAEAAARRAVELRCRAATPDPLAVAADEAALAAILHQRGQDDEAEPLLRGALELYESTLGSDDYEVAVTCSNLGAIAFGRGDCCDAEALYSRAVAIKRALLGDDHPDFALTLNNLAAVQQCQQRTHEAERNMRHALTVLERTLQPDHPTLVTCRQNGAVHAAAA